MRDYHCLCASCYRDLPFYLNRESLNELEVVSIFKYEAVVREFILKYKFSHETELSIFLGKFLLQYLLLSEAVDFITIVPMHRFKFFMRGFNQVALLVRDLGNYKILYDLLTRVKLAKVQSKLSRNLRRKNVKSAFKVNRVYLKLLQNKKILIIDDVYTSGETLKACIYEISKLQPAKIMALTLTRSNYAENGVDPLLEKDL